MSQGAVLRSESLCRRFGGLLAVNDVNVSINRGEVHSIIGPNGAGKSTLFNLLAGRIPPTSGRVIFQDRVINGLPQHRVAQLGIARSYQITTIFRNLTVMDNLLVAAQSAQAFNFWRPASSFKDDIRRAEETLASIGLQKKANSPAAYLSHGEQRHLDIAIALQTNPKILLLDEPTAGMSPVETEQTVDLIRELAKKVTVVLVEHKMDMIMKISDQITVLNFGEVLATGTPAEIQANHEVQRAYLGGGH